GLVFHSSPLLGSVFRHNIENVPSNNYSIRTLSRIFNGSNGNPNLVHQSLVRPLILPYFEKIFPNAFNNSVRLKSVYKYKMKSHSGTKKRWRVTGRGKFKRARSGKAHLNTGVPRARLVRL
ncbi:19607_t:CDS:2, partial [Racocetra persica]